MSTTKDCGHSVPCGCGDTPLTTGDPCPDGIDCTGNPCAENFSTDCIIYTGDTLPLLGLNKGMSMSEFFKVLGPLLNVGAGCVTDPTATCKSSTNLFSTNITDTKITVGWTFADFATTYAVEWSLPGGVWTSSVALANTVNSYELNPVLIPSTEYWIRLKTNCDVGGPCTSVTISVTTLNAI